MTGFSNTFDDGVENSVQIYNSRDVYMHAESRATRPVPCQIGSALPHYTNHDEERARLVDLLTPAETDGPPRLSLIVGAPGSGKSALATQVGNVLRERFPDGIFVAPLGTADEERVRETLLEWMLEVGRPRDEVPDSLAGRTNAWLSWSRGKSVLVVIDDVVTRAQVEPLLPSHGRSAVAVVGARTLVGLTLSTEVTVTVGKLDDAAARELLAKLAPACDLTSDALALETVLRRCDGSVTALNVAGALLGEMSLSNLARRLQDPDRALRTLSQYEGLDMREVFEAAYERFTDDLVRRCYRLFGVHPQGGGVAPEAAGAALEVSADDADDALRTLVRTGLATEAAGERYEIASTELMTAHAAELLDAVGERDTVTTNLVRYYVHRAMASARAWMPKRSWPEVLWGGDLPTAEETTATAKEWLRSERQTLRAVVDLAYALGRLDWVCRLAIALWPLHNKDKHTHDQVAVCERAVEAADALAFPLAASILRQQWAFGLRDLRRFDEAADVLVASITDAEQAGSNEALNSAKEALGLVRRTQGRFEPARQLLHDNHEFALTTSDPRRIALAAFHHATVCQDVDHALELLSESRAEFERLGEADNVLKIDLWRGKRLIDVGAYDKATTTLQEVVMDADDLKLPYIEAEARLASADLAEALHDPEAVRAQLAAVSAIAGLEGYAGLIEDVRERSARLSP